MSLLDTVLDFDLDEVLASPPLKTGRSKQLFALDKDFVLVRLIPSLTSFTYARHELVQGTEVLRLDFYELAASQLSKNGVRTSFVRRVAPDLFVARRCSDPPFEVIVKNVAIGSTQRNYPTLFPEGHRFCRPVVKFDYRTDPEDLCIADDYLREWGLCPEVLKDIALTVNETLQEWLAPRDLLDFCLIVGLDSEGAYTVISEVSPDCMRLRNPDGKSVCKDMFRFGAGREEIVSAWGGLVAELVRA